MPTPALAKASGIAGDLNAAWPDRAAKVDDLTSKCGLLLTAKDEANLGDDDLKVRAPEVLRYAAACELLGVTMKMFNRAANSWRTSGKEALCAMKKDDSALRPRAMQALLEEKCPK